MPAPLVWTVAVAAVAASSASAPFAGTCTGRMVRGHTRIPASLLARTWPASVFWSLSWPRRNIGIRKSHHGMNSSKVMRRSWFLSDSPMMASTMNSRWSASSAEPSPLNVSLPLSRLRIALSKNCATLLLTDQSTSQSRINFELSSDPALSCAALTGQKRHQKTNAQRQKPQSQQQLGVYRIIGVESLSTGLDVKDEAAMYRCE